MPVALVPFEGRPLVGELEDFVIPNGQANSNSVRAKGGNNGALMVYGRSVTDGAIAYNYQFSPNNADWYDLVDSAGANIIPPLQGKAKVLNEVGAFVRIHASANVTANRTWDVTAEL